MFSGLAQITASDALQSFQIPSQWQSNVVNDGRGRSIAISGKTCGADGLKFERVRASLVMPGAVR